MGGMVSKLKNTLQNVSSISQCQNKISLLRKPTHNVEKSNSEIFRLFQTHYVE